MDKDSRFSVSAETYLGMKLRCGCCTQVPEYGSGARWSSGRASPSGFRPKPKGPTGVRNHLRRFEACAILFSPLCLCLSEETVKAVGPFYLISMPGEVKYPTQGNGKKTCDGLTNSTL